MVLNSELTTSYWGDEHMYIRHERMENDLAFKPEWAQYTPKWGGIFGNNLEQCETESQCPFADILKFLQ